MEEIFASVNKSNKTSLIAVSLWKFGQKWISNFHKKWTGYRICINPNQDEGVGGEHKGAPTSFSPVTSTNVEISPKKFLTFSFNPFFHTGVKFQVFIYCQSEIIELEPRPPLKKKAVFLVKFL